MQYDNDDYIDKICYFEHFRVNNIMEYNLVPIFVTVRIDVDTYIKCLSTI